MKKIAVWKVVLLILVTLGIYFIYWAARNRDYIKKSDKKSSYIPAWGWLVTIPAAAFLLVGSILVLMIVAAFNGISVDSALIAMNSAFIAYTVLVMGVGIWWVSFFAKSMEKETYGGITRGLAVALFVFIGPMLAAFYQFYINRGAPEKGLAKYEQSSVFMFFAIGAMAISLIGAAINTADYVRSQPAFRAELEKTQVETRKLTDAFRAYAQCDAHLMKAYPDGEPAGSEQKAAYRAQAERCEVLNKEYLRIVDAL